MNPFTPAQTSALGTLSALWSELDWCLIGASALGCHLDMRWRRTSDLDLVLAVEREALPAGLEAQDGWIRDRRNEHEWHGPGGVRVDIIPAGANLLAVGFVEWRSGHRMSLAGMRHAFSTSVPTHIAEGLTIRVAPLHTLALLKTIAYLDRPLQRERDLEDLAYILEEYVAVDDERRYSEVVPPELEFEVRPAFLLGYDLAPMLNAAERRSVDDFARLAIGEADDPTTSRLLRNAPPRWRAVEGEQRLEAVIGAFQGGLGVIPGDR